MENYNIILSYKKKIKTNMEHFYQNLGEDWFTYPQLYKNMIEKYGEGSHFVEVRSWKGRSAAYMSVEIINSGYNIRFDCVDTWEGSIEHQELDEIKEKKLYDIFLDNIKSVMHVVNPKKMTSLDAAKSYRDESLDFVFIDASHEYQDVLDDINAWMPKLKIGGTIAGHDYGRYDVNLAVNDYFKGKKFEISEDCWIYEKKIENTQINQLDANKNITFVTGLWNIKRDTLGSSWARSFDDYLRKFEELLKSPVNLIIFGDAELEKFVWERRSTENTQFILRGVDSFKNNEFYEIIQKLRLDESWLNLSGWLRESTQASLELYNPLVMSKMFLLNDARILDKFDSKYLFWIDGGITNTVHHGYFTPDMINNLPLHVDKFSFICFPYEAINEIHGFEYNKMCHYAGNQKINKVARGGFFGGPKDTFNEVNGLYYHMLKDTLHDGCMGTEESVFTILMYRYCNKFNYFEIDSNGLLYKFFDELSNSTLKPKTECKDVNQNFNLSTNNTALYIITFNSPRQVEKLILSMLEYDENFVKLPRIILLNNSTDTNTFEEYDRLCEKYNIDEIHKDNLGICGGRQFIAEHAEENKFDFYFFFEDDMFFYPHKGSTCKNGFNRYVDNLYEKSLQIIKNEGFDFLKLSFTEFFGDNGLQWTWYNLPQEKRVEYWPEYNTLPTHGIDPNSPRTDFKNIKSYNGIPYINGEIYYSNWPQVVSRIGNKKMFLDTTWAHPFEQTWMSHMFQLTKKSELRPAILLLSPTEHNRFDHYDGKFRKES
jgi:hypothetical protein